MRAPAADSPPPPLAQPHYTYSRAEEHGRYAQQHEYIQRICVVYETQPGDYGQLVALLQQARLLIPGVGTRGAQSARQPTHAAPPPSTRPPAQMQECGQPPKEIVDELAPGMEVRALIAEHACAAPIANAPTRARAPPPACATPSLAQSLPGCQRWARDWAPTVVAALLRGVATAACSESATEADAVQRVMRTQESRACARAPELPQLRECRVVARLRAAPPSKHAASKAWGGGGGAN